MIQDIIYDAPLFVFEAPTSGSAVAITAYSYDGVNFDATTSISGGETSVVFIH